MSPSTDEKGAAEYGREALAQFREAAHYGARALAERKAGKGGEKAAKGAAKAALIGTESVKSAKGAKKGASAGAEGEDPAGSSPSLKDRLPLPRAGGATAAELGELADAALAKMGKRGKLAAKVGVGHRMVERLLPDPEDEGEEDEGGAAPESAGPAPEAGGAEAGIDSDEHLFDARTPIPIQESIDVAVPVAAVFDLCTRFEELPRFSDRIEEIELEDDTHLTVAAKIGRRQRTLAIEIVGEEPEERLDWEGVDGVEHSGVVTFHPLAPRLTRVELTIEQGSERLRERLLRTVGMPERSVRQELRRFKAYAELWDEANDYKSADFKDPGAPEPADDDEADEPLEDEGPESADQD
jgi:uncharacterized membrane protein